MSRDRWAVVKFLGFCIALAFVIEAARACSRSMDSYSDQYRKAEKQNRWKEPERKMTVTITVNKYTRQECIEADGTFVIGDTKEFGNALIGCIEKDNK